MEGMSLLRALGWIDGGLEESLSKEMHLRQDDVLGMSKVQQGSRRLRLTHETEKSANLAIPPQDGGNCVHFRNPLQVSPLPAILYNVIVSGP